MCKQLLCKCDKSAIKKINAWICFFWKHCNEVMLLHPDTLMIIFFTITEYFLVNVQEHVWFRENQLKRKRAVILSWSSLSLFITFRWLFMSKLAKCFGSIFFDGDSILTQWKFKWNHQWYNSCYQYWNWDLTNNLLKRKRERAMKLSC